jgi:hypothetical protein
MGGVEKPRSIFVVRPTYETLELDENELLDLGMDPLKMEAFFQCGVDPEKNSEIQKLFDEAAYSWDFSDGSPIYNEYEIEFRDNEGYLYEPK